MGVDLVASIGDDQSSGEQHGVIRLARGIAINGISGSGLVQWDDGDANFELYTVRVREDEAVLVLTGRVAWLDTGWEGTELSLESSVIEAYGPAPGQEETAREIRGRMRVNGAEEEPFVLVAVDGPVVAGGLQRVLYDLPGSGTPSAGTPTS